MKAKVLFICIHNSARSQMAEVWLNYTCGDFFEAQNAGLEPGTLNPLAVEAMREVDVDISQKTTQRIFDVFKSSQLFAYVITVCGAVSAARCPIFPGYAKKLYWPFPDPSALTGSEEEKMRQVREIRDEIRQKVEEWCEEVCAPTALAAQS